ncbi:MAG: DUF3800 domain-containing protein [Nitrospirae bacterium]|nr:DUF3800 domain-containing protein [Nitrospirota bacterium]
MHIYLDESGDLGWKFDAPYRKGGSSRYLVLAFLFLPIEHKHKPRNIIRELYSVHKWKTEKKASYATLNQKTFFCNRVVTLLKTHPDIKIDAIIAYKEKVQIHIRNDSNKLYNYMSGLVIPNYIGMKEKVSFIPDQRSVKVKSGNSLADYLQIKIWFDHDLKTTIKCIPCESHFNYNLQFTDWIAHCIWTHFEDSSSKPFNILEPHINVRRLYFPK